MYGAPVMGLKRGLLGAERGEEVAEVDGEAVRDIDVDVMTSGVGPCTPRSL